MIRWTPFSQPTFSDRRLLLDAAVTHQIAGHYVVVAFLPGAGWGGAYGTHDSTAPTDVIIGTNLASDKNVSLVAMSIPPKPDASLNGGPGRAA